MTHTIASVDAHGVTFVPGHTFVDWTTLKAAATQPDEDLAKQYAELLRRAQIKYDWKKYGYPLQTGFGRQYAGQMVMYAWETRRVRRTGHDVLVAYIVRWDRSDGTITREASPEFATDDEALAWVTENYGAWHDQLGGPDTASIWLHA